MHGRLPYFLFLITITAIPLQAEPDFTNLIMIVTGFNQGAFEIGFDNSTYSNKKITEETYINSSIGIGTGWFIHSGLAVGPQAAITIISRNENSGFRLNSLTLLIGAFTAYYWPNVTEIIPFINLDANFRQNFTSTSGPATKKVTVGNSGFLASIYGGFAYFITDWTAIETFDWD